MLDRKPSATVRETELGCAVSHNNISAFLSAAEKQSLVLKPKLSLLKHDIIFALNKVRCGALLHHFEGHLFISIDALHPDDYHILAELGSHMLVRALGSSVYSLAQAYQFRIGSSRSSFQIFYETGSPIAASGILQQYRQIGLLEFILSTSTRLHHYPTISTTVLQGTGTGPARIKVVFVLDLIQDFEVLRPLINRCVENSAWSNLHISVSERVVTSHLWPLISVYLDVMQLKWFKPISPVDVINALGNSRAVLITASESSANGHKFSHTVCQLARKTTLKITVQHGYECVGLRHHLAHDHSHPQGVRFASDVVLTWASEDQLTSIHPNDLYKCLPVGIVKTSAIEAAVENYIGERLGHTRNLSTPSARQSNVLVAENLHSVRFVDTDRYQRFLDFIRGLDADRAVNLTLRSHPGKRTLEQSEIFKGYAFLTGSMRAQSFKVFDAFISPPSTIVLDAVLAGVPTGIWSARENLGDCENYTRIPVLKTANEVRDWLDDPDLPQAILYNYEWALANNCSLNGIPQAWSRMNELAFGI